MPTINHANKREDYEEVQRCRVAKNDAKMVTSFGLKWK
jgi:hypothetical protein